MILGNQEAREEGYNVKLDWADGTESEHFFLSTCGTEQVQGALAKVRQSLRCYISTKKYLFEHFLVSLESPIYVLTE